MLEYIDREAVIMDILRAGKIGKLSCVDIIKHAPAADVRPVVRGNWVGIDDEPFTTWECDRCGCIYEVEFEYLPNFCPNCGADMRPIKQVGD